MIAKPASIATAVLLTCSAVAMADQGSKSATGESTEDIPESVNESQAPATGGLAVFQPPLRGAPARRVGGATRGTDGETLFLTVLAPEGIGLTIQESPNLYWFVSDVPNRAVEFALIRDDRIEPVTEATLTAHEGLGIAKISLADLGVTLEPDVAYEWSIALVADYQQRSQDIVTSGMLQRVIPDADLGTKLQAEDTEDRLVAYAGAGYWYDAIDLVSSAIASETAAQRWKAHRTSLLEQVDLPQVAAYDRSL